MMKTLLMAGGLVLLLPVALLVVFGTLVAGVVAAAALIGLAIKLAPLLAIGLILYWVVARPRRTLHSGQ